VSVIIYKNRKTIFKSFDVGNKNKSTLPIKEQAICNALDEGKALSVNKTTKTIPNNQKNVNSLENLIKNQSKQKKEVYKLTNKDFKQFLGDIEIKQKESVVITLTGGQGSMKTRFAFQFVNAFAQNYKVGHISIEEHPESSLFINKAKEYIKPQLYKNIEVPMVSSVHDIHKTIMANDVIVIDSFQKLKELDKNLEIDKDFRKKYNGKLFFIIFQQTTTGTMRGGSKSQFDADIVLFTEKLDDYKENFVYNNKNRYLNTSFDALKYNIYSKKTLKNQQK